MPSKYIRKTRDIFIIQGYYGSEGWEDVNAELTRKDARRSLREYRENDPKHSYRVIKKRERISDTDSE